MTSFVFLCPLYMVITVFREFSNIRFHPGSRNPSYFTRSDRSMRAIDVQKKFVRSNDIIVNIFSIFKGHMLRDLLKILYKLKGLFIIVLER